MKGKIQKLCVFGVFLLMSVFSVSLVKAKEDLPMEAHLALDSFFMNLNYGAEKVYDYIDSSNQELSNHIKEYLGEMEVRYSIKDVTKVEEDQYRVKLKISAEGKNWNLNGFSVDVDLKKIDGTYKVFGTTLFEVVGPENVFRFVGKIFLIVFGLFACVSLLILFLVVYFLHKNKKAKENVVKPV